MNLNFLGDVYLNEVFNTDIKLENFIFNLEYPLSTKGIPAKNKVNLGVDNKEYIKLTFKDNPIAVNLANNHIMDYGEEAFKETIEYLEKENIKYFGAGNKTNNYNNPLIINLDNKKIALFAYCCQSTSPVMGELVTNGAAPLEISVIENDLKNISEDIDYKIINLHWGDEEISYPKPDDIQKAHNIIDLGADLIIGHHAHVIQSTEIYKEKNIFYGIGNFVFPNLNVPKMFNGENFQGKYIKTQNNKNKQSIIVSLSNDLSIDYKTTFFDSKNKKVILKNIKIPKWLPKTNRHYKAYKKIWSKQRMLELYIKNPRIPSIKQIKLFLGINK